MDIAVIIGCICGLALGLIVCLGIVDKPVATLYYWTEPFDGPEGNVADEVCFKLEWDKDPVDLVKRGSVRIKVKETQKNPFLK